MAFGKEREHLQGVTPFGAGTSIAQRTQFLMRNQGEQRQRKGGGGMRFSDIFKPTLSPTSFDLVRIIPGNYTFQGCDGKKNVYTYPGMEYWPFIEHYDGRNKKSTICSGGVFHNFRDAREPCMGCDLFFSTMDKQKDANGRRKSRVSKQDKYVFNVLHYNPYHKIPQMDDSGRVACNDQGQPYYNWVPCEGRGCKICPQGVETMPARMLKWEMSYSHFKAITTAYSLAIGQDCANCGTQKSIQPLAWVCSAEGCGEAVIDMADTTYSDEDIAKVISEPVTCPHCKNNGFLNEVFACGACQNPRRATIFDVSMNVKRTESGQGDSKQTQLIVSSWSQACNIEPQYQEMAKPFDLPKIYGPSTIDFQKKMFGMEGVQAEGQPVQPGGMQRTPVNAGQPAQPNAGFRNYQNQNQGGQGPTGPNFSR